MTTPLSVRSQAAELQVWSPIAISDGFLGGNVSPVVGSTILIASLLRQPEHIRKNTRACGLNDAVSTFGKKVAKDDDIVDECKKLQRLKNARPCKFEHH